VQTSLQEPPRGTRHTRRQPRPLGLALEHGRDRVGNRRALERSLPREQLVHDAAERPNVGAPIDRESPRLLRAHVRGRPEHDPFVRPFRRDRDPGLAGAGLPHLRKPEVEHLHDARAIDLDVGRLQVPVHDALVVRRLERRCDLSRDPQRLGNGQRPAAAIAPRDQLREGLPVHELHDEPADAVAFLDAVDRCDVRMIERGQHFRLALEARKLLGVNCELFRQDLDRDLAPEARIACAINLTHRARPDEREDLVRPEM
jgi:hypothetical protein